LAQPVDLLEDISNGDSVNLPGRSEITDVGELDEIFTGAVDPCSAEGASVGACDGGALGVSVGVAVRVLKLPNPPRTTQAARGVPPS